MTEKLIQECQLDEINREKFKDTILLPHTHQYQREFRNQLDVGERLKLSCFSRNKDQKENPIPVVSVNLDDPGSKSIKIILHLFPRTCLRNVSYPNLTLGPISPKLLNRN